MLGHYSVADGTVRFIPRYPLRGGMQYIAQCRPGIILNPGHEGPPITSRYTAPQPPPTPRGRVTAVYPSADVLPENLLKLYVHFSTPMARGEAYRHVRLEDSAGRLVERPFLEIGEELWDPQGRRLTLLFDPGRIKRGLVPRQEEGPILEEGKAYTLRVDADWPDADGRPLARGVPQVVPRRSAGRGPTAARPMVDHARPARDARRPRRAIPRAARPRHARPGAERRGRGHANPRAGRGRDGRDLVVASSPTRPGRRGTPRFGSTPSSRTWPATASLGRSRSICSGTRRGSCHPPG